MKFNTLGTTDIKVSEICLGTMTFGEQNSEKEGHEQLDYATDHDVNFIDTAEMYSVPGRKETAHSTEKIVGSWLANRKDRDKLIIATKITGPSAGITWIRNPLDFSPASIKTALEGSLKRLQTDYIDLYQLHWPERKTNFFGKRGYIHDENDPWVDNINEVLNTLNDYVKAGKIRHIGISNETPYGMMRYLEESAKNGLPRVVSIQNPYSLLNRTFEVGLAEMAIKQKVGLLAYSPLAFGLLSGKYHQKKDHPTDRLNTYKQMSRYESEQCYNATAQYLEIAQSNNMSLTQMALAWINTRPFLTSNIIGATTLAQLKENISSTEFEITKEMEKAIEAVQNKIPNPAP